MVTAAIARADSRLRAIELNGTVITSAAALASVIAGAWVVHVTTRTVLDVVAPLVLLAIARRQWGSIAVIAIPFLLPDIGPHLGLEGRVLLTVATTLLALVYWHTLNKPRISSRALWAASVFSLATLILTSANSYNIQGAIWISMIPFGGIVFGTCLAANSTARKALGYGCLPLALLAIAEVGGLHNPWPNLVHATNFLAASQRVSAKRAQSTFGHPLIAGACLAGVAAIMLHARTRYSTFIAAVLAGGAVATVSRSAVVGLAFALVCGLLIGQKRQRQILKAIAIAAFALVLVTHISALKESITNRATGVSYSEQPVRRYAIERLKRDFAQNVGALLIGGGNGRAQHDLEVIGGINGYIIFDNQYVTSTYDLGLIPMLIVGWLVLSALIKASPESRAMGLPALAGVAAVMFFVDGAGWISLSFLAWTTVGLATTPGPQERCRRVASAYDYAPTHSAPSVATAA